MGNVIEHNFTQQQEGFEVDYILTPDNEVVGISHPEWNFQITRSDDGKLAAFVTDDGEAFGELPADKFNTLLISWLLIDDPSLVDEAADTK